MRRSDDHAILSVSPPCQCGGGVVRTNEFAALARMERSGIRVPAALTACLPGLRFAPSRLLRCKQPFRVYLLFGAALVRDDRFLLVLHQGL